MSHAELLKLSERMLDAARAGDWDSVVALEGERSRQLTALSDDDAGSLPLFRALLTHTEEVRALAGRQRDLLSADMDQHQHRHRALSAYLHAGID
jgi:flagellar protein FliT